MNKYSSLFRWCRSSSINKTHFCTKNEKDSPLKSLLENAASFNDINPGTSEQLWATLPYAEGTKINKAGVYPVEKIDPREKTIIVFAGQGHQFVGMGKNLLKFPMVQDLFAQANYILGYDLLKLCLEGPKGELDQTIYNQPATFVISLACLERLREERPNAIDNCVATAGFSLGEFSALVFAGAIQFERALQLVKIRAEAMQLACDAVKTGMLSCLFGADCNINFVCKKAREFCIEQGIENPVCSVACYLHPNSKVIAGNIEAIQFVEKNYKQFKLWKVYRLNVSGAFHTDLMLPALEPFKIALQKTEINAPLISVHSNIDGKRYQNVEHIKKVLPKQIVKPVKWEQTLHILYERHKGDYFPRTFECGPGKVLTNILKRVNAKAWDSSLSIDPS